MKQQGRNLSGSAKQAGIQEFATGAKQGVWGQKSPGAENPWVEPRWGLGSKLLEAEDTYVNNSCNNALTENPIKFFSMEIPGYVSLFRFLRPWYKLQRDMYPPTFWSWSTVPRFSRKGRTDEGLNVTVRVKVTPM